ncbi:hemolysin family protein [Rarobacter faecitabidus]|uniref:CBS domain containing-hemolysin-like protein n=1 Tax=Rarobacter faecitabidus TaxID=13243 RepID=A0A542ZV92_RARFA|nr:hemolysin family protein [Rarobacter faecitabidus]TQL64176.1 CBS domain containing-hemolysin-like protein [Rarobacter faecitabidus]
MGTAPIELLFLLALAGNVLAALLSAGEAATLRASRSQVADLIARKPNAEARLNRISADPQRTASAAALVRVISETIAAVCLTVAIGALVDAWWLVLIIASGVSIVIALLLVRVSPRTIGRNRPGSTLGWASGLLSATLRIARLAPWAVATRPTAREEGPSGAIVDMVDRAEESGVIEADERKMLQSVVELSHTLTREVMVPRTDMISINEQETLRKGLRLFLRSGYSRVPVIGESTDDMLGVLYFKDLVRVIEAAGLGRESVALGRKVGEVMRPAMFVPESKPVDSLLREFQAASSHVALVVDEYGGIAGLVTIEDAIEEIVGELTDEHDTAAPEIEDLGGDTFRVPARCPLDELGSLFGIEIDDDDVDTVSGLLAKLIGRVPLPGAQAEINGVQLTAERSEGRRKRLATVIASRVRQDEPAAAAATNADGQENGRD